MLRDPDSDDAYHKLRIEVCSDARRTLFLSLLDGEKSLSDLRDESGKDSPTLVHSLRELEKAHLVVKDARRNYVLTSIGRVMARRLIDAHHTMTVLSAHKMFWLEHDLSSIPDPLLSHIGYLYGSTLIEAKPSEPLSAFNEFIRLLEDAKTIRLLISIVINFDWTSHKELQIKALFPTLRYLDGHSVHNIVTREVLDGLIEITSRERLAQAIDHGLDFRITDEYAKLALAVTDRHTLLGLHTLNGVFDFGHMLVSDSPDGLKWGNALWAYYSKRSHVVTL
jgi:predicted transcriptional regulator